MSNILVVGVNRRLVNFPPLSPQSDTTPPQPQVAIQGPWGPEWQESLLRTACSDLDAKGTNISSLLLGAKQPAQSFVVWSLQDRVLGDKTKVWRVEQFLGTEGATGPMTISSDQTAHAGILVVLGDYDLTFQSSIGSFLSGSRGLEILWCLPVLDVGSGILPTLSDETLSRLSVVLPAESLRARNAPLTSGLSWDRTIEELTSEVARGQSRHDLGRVRRLIVSYGLEGVAAFAHFGGR
jgi:hypothetical protein